MSFGALSADGPHRNGMVESLRRFGHYTMNDWQVYVAISLVPTVRGASWIGWVAVMVLFPYLAASVVGAEIHRGRLCEECISDWPLDVQEQADRKLMVLKAVHFLRSHMGLGVLAACVAVAGTIGYLLPRIHMGAFTWTLLLPCILVVILPAGWMFDTHSRLRAGCPMCRRDDGGGENFVPLPTPDPSAKVR